MVPVSVCLAADLEESFEWGRHHRAGRAGRAHKRVGFVASGSVSHKLVRGPGTGPKPEDEELDHRLAKMLARRRVPAGSGSGCPSSPRRREPEMGGRHLAMMLGAILESGQRFAATCPRLWALRPGSGNYVISLTAS